MVGAPPGGLLKERREGKPPALGAMGGRSGGGEGSGGGSGGPPGAPLAPPSCRAWGTCWQGGGPDLPQAPPPQGAPLPPGPSPAARATPGPFPTAPGPSSYPDSGAPYCPCCPCSWTGALVPGP